MSTLSRLERDFARDGVAASWADGQPSTWNSDTPSLTLPGACITGSISPGEELLAALIPGAIVIASLNTVTISQTIEVEGAEKATQSYHLEWQPGRQYTLLFSTPELTKLYHINRDTLAVVTSHSLDNRAVPSLTSTAFNPSGTRLVLQHKPDPPAEPHLEVWTTTPDTAPPTLDATLATSSSTAATSWNPTGAPLLAFSTLSSTSIPAPAPDDSASSSLEPPPSPLHIWDITAANSTNNPRPIIPPPQHHPHQPWRHAFSPCGTYITLSAGTHGLVWHAQSGALLADVCVAPAWWARCVPAWQPTTSLASPADGYAPRVAFGGAGGGVTVVRLQARQGEEEVMQAVVEQERRGRQGGGTMEVLAGEVSGVEWVDGGKGLMFDTGRDGGVEIWHGERNMKWRMEQPAGEQQEKRKKGVVVRWCEGRKMVVVLDREVGVVRFWRMP